MAADIPTGANDEDVDTAGSSLRQKDGISATPARYAAGRILHRMTGVLPPRAVEWVRTSVPGATTVRVQERFAGATSSSLHAIEVDRTDGPPLPLVLRRYTDARVRTEEPQYPRTEATALHALDGAPGVLAPRLVAVDERGTTCDVPAVLMTRLPGRPTLSPSDVGAWVRGLAEALTAVHRVDGAAVEGSYRRWHDPQTAVAPLWSRQPEAWTRLIDASRSREPSGHIVLLHRDFHPANVLWLNGRVSGVVDWPNACHGVAALDVGHCRRDIVMTHGVAVAEAFLTAYGEASKRAPDALCDALTLLDISQVTNVTPYHAYGRTDLTVESTRARLDEYAALVAGRL
ncbi:MAG: aminoglycoside phosphotransferase family protein [Dehalococcoidia bacterium]|nr:MAG: aminoglycoside phosphotransferase family protein [Dehalococcoidia bacterium]